ncbi:cation-translocating P-type ATPase [Faecalicatena contorta]|uniref:cation-translocating P-type ATPase n=1 Tax=Faecalicatena contorta TaxID=39482 RepID=UPI001F1FC365|nr:cation-translocating P-type ATPase [Faecalicatena contorta]MCF2668173.1 cation-translocating P-type ATPase [Faecalicatena contorta]
MKWKSRQEVQEREYDYEVERTPVTRYQPVYTEGLTNRQVQEHRDGGWSNLSVDPPAQTTKEIIHENVFTYFNLIFLVLAILLCLVGSFRNLTFLPVIIINTLIGIIQEIRSKNVLAKLNMLNAPHASVVREGKESVVDSEELVLDDIVLFKSGNQICADAVVVEGEVRVNEALLTGESDEIIKRCGEHLMSGSFVVAGQCHARLEAVGVDSYISKLTLEAKAMQKGEQSEMIRSLDKLVKCVGVALIPIGIVLFVQGFFFNGETFRNSITSMVAAVIGMIPEGLYLLASVALAVSAMRLAKKKVLLHDMKSIETLARVNVLCVDKTGTITENSMSVKKLVPTQLYDKETTPELEKLVGDFVKAMGSDNSTMEALKEYFKDGTGAVAVRTIPFTSATKYSGVVFEEKSYVLGAPEFVLREDYETYRLEIQTYAKRGYRVLVFGTYEGTLEGTKLTEKVLPLGYILLANPIRKEAPETFAYFAEQGVEVKVISGDNPMTVSEVAKEAGIENAEEYIDATTLTTDEDVERAVAKYTVFGRVTPAQKRQFVQALKKQGKTVAMTGDGVNDVLALKDADCSVAMASGSDAAAQASQVVLLESDFSCMPSVVLEGRRVVNNIQRSATLFLVKNIFSFLLSLFSVVFMITYPLEPSQVSLISMFTIGVPAFFLALQPNKDLIKGHFLPNVILKALPAALTDVLAVGSLVVFGQIFAVGATDISTAATMLLAIVGFMILYRICQPFNVFRIVIWVGCVIGLLACSIFLPDLFAITGMSTKCIMLFVVFSIATEPVLRYLTMLIGGMQDLHKKIFHKKA